VAQATSEVGEAQTARGRRGGPLSALSRRRLVVVTGKGGVGKTVVAAALGRLFAGRGRRVLLLEVDPRENAHLMLGLPPSGGEIVAAGEGLWLQNLKPRQALDDLIRERVRVGVVARRVLASPIYHQLTEGMPGLREVAVVHHALSLARGAGGEGPGRRGADPGFDLVVLDAPATGHGVSLLAAPQLVAAVITSGPVGRLAAELAAFVADPERCGIAVVTLAEEMPVDEAVELRAMLGERVGRRPELLVVNALYPPVGPEAADGDDAVGLWRRRRRVNERELARLDHRWPGPRLELPLLPIDRGPELVAALAAALEAAGGGGAP
jgi:anion-transporting  ArsA/GET3 family ATPase